MVLELLQSIEKAEADAEVIRENAQLQAREILKSAEEECTAIERASVQENRALLRQESEATKEATAKVIASEEEAKAVERAALRDKARVNLPKAVAFIVERMLSDGPH